MHLFYTPNITSETYTLSEEESKHAVRVLRLKIGDTVHLIDGTGGYYTASIIDDNQKRCTVKIVTAEKEFGKRTWKLHIAIAPVKNMDRMEWFVEKAVEIGIDEISLLDCSKSERTIIKTERLHKTAVAAMKQSIKAYLPKINELAGFDKFINDSKSFSGEKFIAHCHSRESLPHIKTYYALRQNIMILIGPEGDFSEDEVKLAVNHGFKEISLGKSRLRTETAALYACAFVNLSNE